MLTYRIAARLINPEQAAFYLVIDRLIAQRGSMLSYATIADHYSGRKLAGTSQSATNHEAIAKAADALCAAGYIWRERGGDGGSFSKRVYGWGVNQTLEMPVANFAYPHTGLVLDVAVEREREIGAHALWALLRIAAVADRGGVLRGTYKGLQHDLGVSRAGIVSIIQGRLADASLVRVTSLGDRGFGESFALDISVLSTGVITEVSLIAAEPNETVDLKRAFPREGKWHGASTMRPAPISGIESHQPKVEPIKRSPQALKTPDVDDCINAVHELNLRADSQEVLGELFDHLEERSSWLTDADKLSIVKTYGNLLSSVGNSTAAEYGVREAIKNEAADWFAYARATARRYINSGRDEVVAA